MITTSQKYLLDQKMNGVAHKVLLGTELHKCYNVVKATYDFAVDGGAVGSYGLGVTIPDNAIVTKAYLDVLTACVSTGNDGTIAFTVESAGDLKAAVDADTLSGVVACIPTGAAASMIKLTADREITATIATHALTAGKINIYVEYVLGD